MKSITKPDHPDNIGSIIKLWYIPIYDVASISRPIHDYGGITLKANKQWLEMYFSPQSASHLLKFKPGPKGSFYDSKITGVIPKHDINHNTSVNLLLGAAFVCKILDANGYYRIIGTLDFPLHFSYDSDSGKKPSDRNSIGFIFFGQSKYAPFFITSQAGQGS